MVSLFVSLNLSIREFSQSLSLYLVLTTLPSYCIVNSLSPADHLLLSSSIFRFGFSTSGRRNDTFSIFSISLSSIENQSTGAMTLSSPFSIVNTLIGLDSPIDIASSSL